MSKEEILSYLKNYLNKKANNSNNAPIELVVEPRIILPWGIVVRYDTKEFFETGKNGLTYTSPIFFDSRLEKIVPLKLLIPTREGKRRRITIEHALELYRKENNLSLLNKKQYQDLINRTCFASYSSNMFLWKDYINESEFEELLEIIENYKELTKHEDSIDKATIANIYSVILDLAFKQKKAETPEPKKKLMKKMEEKLKAALEELFWNGIKRVDSFTGEVWYGVNKRE